MHKTELHAREKTYTQAGPMDIDAGRLVANEALQLAIITGGALALGSVCVLIAQLAIGGDSYEPGPLRALRGFGLLFGASGAFLAYGFSFVIAWLTVRGWIAYQNRLADWHDAQLVAYEGAGGQAQEREVTIKSLSLSEPAHLLLVALAVVERHRADGGAPWSSTNLRGEVWIGNMRVGDLGKRGAEDFSAALAAVGLVKGRGKGAAGQLVTDDLSQVLDIVKRGYGKVKPGELARVERGELED